MICIKTIISGFLLLFFSTSYSQTVDFIYTTGNNLFCNPQEVIFTQTCTGNPINFIWRFGNGQSGTSPMQKVTYALPGTYSVSLTAIYSSKAISVTKTVVINPTPAFSVLADRIYMCQTGNINFSAQGSTFNSTYEWNFGDGTPVQITTSNSVSHFFGSYNNFNVKVTATTPSGCSRTDSTSVLLKKFTIVDDSVTPYKGCIPVNAILTASASFQNGDFVSNYAWNFGDGTPIVNTSVNNTSHTYNTVAAITTAGVTMTSSQGCINQRVFPAFGFGTPPFNTIAVTSDGKSIYCGGETVKFNGFAVNANMYSWDFGDSNIVATNNTTVGHRYRSLGNKRVILTPLFNGCEGAKDTIDITMIGVAADYTFTNQCSAKSTYFFNNLSPGNVSFFRWTFSDSPVSADSVNYNITHRFPVYGSFFTNLYVIDSISGCSDTLTTYQFTATPSLISNKMYVCKDSLIQYTVLNPYPASSNYQYEFHVPGLSVRTGTISSYAFSPIVHGTFNDFVAIDGPGNNTCNDTLYLPANTYVRGPVLDFSLPITASCFLNNSFPVTNNTFPFFPADIIKTWEWNFGDLTTDNTQFPLPHSYAAPAAYKLVFKATDINGCAQKDSMIVKVHQQPELIVFPEKDTLCTGQSHNLLAFTIDTLLWKTNYNLTCLSVACDTISVNPMITTNYIAQAKNQYGCISTDTSYIRVYAPFTLLVFPADTSVCPKEIVPYKTNVNGIATWFPSTYLSSSNINNPSSKPDSTISYSLIITDSAGCYADTATAIIKTFTKPTVNAGPDQLIPFNNVFTLSPAYSSGITNYLWSPPVNSLSCTSCPVTTGISNVTAKYTIEVTSPEGCKAKDDIVVFVACSKSNLHLPSAFTPNNDGKNDMFYPITSGYKTINKFIIFDRWANKIFERYNFAPNQPSSGWNGNTMDKQASGSNVFVWVIEATCDFGERVESKGTVVLIR